MKHTYTIPYRTNHAIASKAEWQSITPLFVAEQQWIIAEHKPEVQARLLYTTEALHIQFIVFESEPLSRYTRHGDPVYEDSCVEFFFQPLPATDERYFNFELNSKGTLLLEVGGEQQRQRIIPDDCSLFNIHAATGLLDPANGQLYWELSYSIPFSFISQYFPAFQASSGTRLRGNFYKCGDRTQIPHYLSWRPVQSATPNYHQCSFFGELILL
jgi:hypothetical protein